MDVLAKPVVSYDHHSIDYAASYREVATDMLANAPVAWSDTYGGFWVISRYDDVRFVAENWDKFSSENRGPEDTERRGIMIPSIPVPLMLNECDPPIHTKRRMIEVPYFTPKHLRRWVSAAVAYTQRAIDDVIETGEVEFFKDLCLRVPAMTVLHVAGVDSEDWELFAEPLTIYGPEGAERAQQEIMGKLHDLLAERREDPREDMASALSQAKVDGEPMDIDVAAGMLHTIVTGGFDTATSLLCNALDWLEQHPAERELLRAHPDLMENAVEEFLRQFPPLNNLARNVVNDIEMGGQLLRAGDRVQMSLYAANHDPAKFPDPFKMDFRRENAREHVAYSAGNHRCLGAPLARIELRHVLSEVLRRMPDYRIDRSHAQRMETIGLINGWTRLPATFTPGHREAAASGGPC